MPFSYLIGWTDHNVWYYGIRFAKGCHPDDMWTTYFTSSKYVHEFSEKHGKPDIIQIRKIFDDKNDAKLWESKVFKRLNIVKREDFLNRTDAGETFLNLGGYKLPPRSEEHCRKISESKKGTKFPEERKKILSKKYSGKGNPNYGRVASKETRQKIRDAQDIRPFVINNKKYIRLQDAVDEFGLNSRQIVYYRLNSRTDRWKDWYYCDTGPQPVKKVKRPDLAELNRQRAKCNANQ